MNRDCKKIILWVMLLIWAGWAIAVAEEVNSVKGAEKPGVIQISLSECIQLALQNNLGLSVERINPLQRDADILKEEGVFNPVMSSGIQYSDVTTPLSSQETVAAGGLMQVREEEAELTSGISGKLPYGTEYEVSFDSSRLTNTFNQFQSEYDEGLSFTLTQPLIKDFGSGTNLAQLVIARNNRNISNEELRLKAMDTVAEVEGLYWDLVWAVRELEVRRTSKVLARKLLDDNRTRVEVGVLPQIEVVQAEAGLAGREESVIVAEQIVERTRNNLRRLIYSDTGPNGNLILIPSDSPVVKDVEIDYEEAVRIALENRPDLKTAGLSLENQLRQLAYSKNQTLPSIDLKGGYSYKGLSGNFSDGLDQLSGAESPGWFTGVVASYPWGNETARGEYRRISLEKEKTRIHIREIKENIRVDIANIIGEILSAKKRVDAAGLARKLAEQSLEAEEEKLSVGMTTSHDVLDYQEELAQAQSREIRAIVDHNKALLSLLHLEGTLLKERNVELFDNT